MRRVRAVDHEVSRAGIRRRIHLIDGIVLGGKRIATEYVRLATRYFEAQGVRAEVEFSWGACEVKVPQLSESIAEATLLQWKKRPGEAVEQDEILVEIETDKVVLEVPAPADGVLAEIVKGDGSTVTSDEVIARINDEAAASAPAPTPAPEVPSAVAASPAGPPKSDAAMPAAAKLMADHGIAPGSVAGPV